MVLQQPIYLIWLKHWFEVDILPNGSRRFPLVRLPIITTRAYAHKYHISNFSKLYVKEFICLNRCLVGAERSKIYLVIVLKSGLHGNPKILNLKFSAKVLNSLSEKFQPKITVIEEKKGIDSLKIESETNEKEGDYCLEVCEGSF